MATDRKRYRDGNLHLAFDYDDTTNIPNGLSDLIGGALGDGEVGFLRLVGDTGREIPTGVTVIPVGTYVITSDTTPEIYQRAGILPEAVTPGQVIDFGSASGWNKVTNTFTLPSWVTTNQIDVDISGFNNDGQYPANGTPQGNWNNYALATDLPVVVVLGASDTWPNTPTSIKEGDFVILNNGDVALFTNAVDLAVTAGSSTGIPTRTNSSWSFLSDLTELEEAFLDEVSQVGSNFDLSPNVRVDPINVESLSNTYTSANIPLSFLNLSDERGQGEAATPLMGTLTTTSGVTFPEGYIEVRVDIDSTAAAIQDIAAVQLRFTHLTPDPDDDPTATTTTTIIGRMDLNSRGPVTGRFYLGSELTTTENVELIVNYFYRQADVEDIVLSNVMVISTHTGLLYQPIVDLINDLEPDVSPLAGEINGIDARLTTAEGRITTLDDRTDFIETVQDGWSY